MRRAFIPAAAAAFTLLAAAGAGAAPAAPSPAPKAAPSTPAPAGPSDPIVADVHCVLIGASMASSSDAQAQPMGNATTFFYLGRLQGRISDAQLEEKMFAELPKLKDVGQSEAHRCLDSVASRGNAFQTIGDHLEKRLSALPASQRPTGAPPAAAAPPAATPPKN